MVLLLEIMEVKILGYLENGLAFVTTGYCDGW
jgi:hypothetical protein